MARRERVVSPLSASGVGFNARQGLIKILFRKDKIMPDFQENKNIVMHFTHTGYYAGTPYCGIDKAAADQEKHAFMHPRGDFARNYRDRVCPKCLAIWENCGKCEKEDCEGCDLS
jgi:hypothetical protein